MVTKLLVPDKMAKRLLIEKLSGIVPTKLCSAGFVAANKSRTGFSTSWLRDRHVVIDMLEFQWDTLERPSFIINFRQVDHPNDIAAVRKAPKMAQPGDFGLRLYMKQSPFGWFKPRLFFRSSWTIDGEMRYVTENVVKGLDEVVNFFDGGPATRFMQDSPNWLDPRLPDDPPPWSSGGLGSGYHLPTRRVGHGQNLWASQQ